MIIKGLQKFTLIDFPGKLACTIFTFGCNFRCPYCQNPELVVDDGRKPINESWILKFLQQRRSFLEGACVSGGEPTIQGDLIDFLAKVKRIGYSVKLDTNGSNPKMLKEALEGGLVDYVAMDIKAPLKKYDEVARVKVDREKIKESIRVIRNLAPNYEFRITAVPGLLTNEDYHEIGRWLRGAKNFYIQQFQGAKTLDRSFTGRKPLSNGALIEIQKTLSKYFRSCKVRVSS